MIRRRSARVALVFASLVAGCAMGPDYTRPAQDLPADYRWRDTGDQPGSLGDLGWWQVYRDPQLQELLRDSLAGNPDVRIAVEHIAQAAAQLGATDLQFLPTIDASGSEVRRRLSVYQALPGSALTGNSFSNSFNLSYELDFWGRIRRLDEQQRALLLSTEAAKDDVAASLIGNVVTADFQLVSLDHQLVLTRDTLKARETFVALTRARHDRGVVSGLDVAAAEAQLAVARAQIPDIERQIGQTEDLVSTLLGRPPGPIARGADWPVLPPVPPGLPSGLLDRRPDLREAEQQLVAANANVGVVKAALFPTISLTGAFGAVAPQLSKLGSGAASAWSLGPAITLPLLDPQRNLFEVELAQAEKRAAIEQYRKTVLTALREVSDALIARSRDADLVLAQQDQVDAFRRSKAIALARYRQGYASYFDVIDADSQLFAAELTLATARRDALLATVQLYQALGGGWQAEQVEEPAGR